MCLGKYNGFLHSWHLETNRGFSCYRIGCVVSTTFDVYFEYGRIPGAKERRSAEDAIRFFSLYKLVTSRTVRAEYTLNSRSLVVGGVCALHAGCNAMLKVKHNGLWVVSVLLVPPCWRHFEIRVWSSQGAIENMCVNEKQEAASAIEFAEEESHSEENEKSRQQARAIRCCSNFIVHGTYGSIVDCIEDSFIVNVEDDVTPSEGEALALDSI